MKTELLAFWDIEKSFGRKRVLQGLSSRFSAGNYALLGRNGAGKSTLLSLLAGSEPLDKGSVVVCGYDLATSPIQAKARLSYVPDKPIVYPFLTGKELLVFVGSAKRSKDISVGLAVAEELGLTPHLEARFEQMSLGTKRKFLIAAAFIGCPDVILMDEPSNGLDLAAKQWLAESLVQESQERLVLFSSHDTLFMEAADAQRLELRQGRELLPWDSSQTVPEANAEPSYDKTGLDTAECAQ